MKKKKEKILNQIEIIDVQAKNHLHPHPHHHHHHHPPHPVNSKARRNEMKNRKLRKINETKKLREEVKVKVDENQNQEM